ncbi:peptidase inhibitor family I36 protein [Streptomyces sp. 4N509B]|uniref:peptidase inhibitor family I36 protein n=1 Tax=Streptomyces sp. 4N509B TaxID=3457413 RepID=UPI003FD15F61
MRKNLARVAVAVMVACASLTMPVVAAEAQQQNDPELLCRAELNKHEALQGMCFWSGENYTGDVQVIPNPAPPDVCGAIDPASSAVNLTRDTREIYAFSNCVPTNLITEIGVNEAIGDFGRGIFAGSWR